MKQLCQLLIRDVLSIYIGLPLLTCHKMAVRGQQSTGCKRVASQGWRPYSVLCSGDDLREAAQEILQSLGYKVIAACDGEDAARKFADNAENIDLIFADVVMPKDNGPEAYLKMVSVRPGIPVIFTTGYATETNLISVKARQHATVLPKPYGAQYLAQKIREALDRRDERKLAN